MAIQNQCKAALMRWNGVVHWSVTGTGALRDPASGVGDIVWVSYFARISTFCRGVLNVVSELKVYVI